MFLECLRASIIGLERADLSVTGLTSMTQRMSAPWVQGRGHKARLEAMSGEDSRIETGGLSSFLDDSEGISATIARRASAAAGAFLVTEVPHAPVWTVKGFAGNPSSKVEA